MSAIDALRDLQSRGSKNGTVIAVNGRPMRYVTDDALHAIIATNSPAAVFVRGGALARIRRDENDRPIIDQLGEAGLRGILARAAHFVVFTNNGDRHIPPPRWTVQDVLALGSWSLPALEGITETPVLRADGSLLVEPGYDPATRLVYMPAPGLVMPSISAAPGAADIQTAVAVLNEALTDFPFEDEASHANALALMLTPVVRPAIGGQVPLALVDATKAGTGKGLLISLVAQVATGQPAAILAALKREEEWQKTLLSVIARGSTFIAIDEAAELDSPSLAAALTAPIFEGRLLGRTETLRLPQRATWAAAGNNIQVKGDLARRCYWIRLDAKTARPWQRSGFLHPNLHEWASQRRGQLLGALLTLSRAWYASGRPASPVPVMGGFEAWARTVGSILGHAGIGGFLGNLEAFYDQADQEAAEWETFLGALAERQNDQTFTVADLARELDDDACALRDALPNDLADALDKKPSIFKTKLGKALGRRKGTRYGTSELRVERISQDTRSQVATWRVLRDEGA
jgi:hypothetical protein